MSKGIFKFLNTGEDDGTQKMADDGYILCNRCNTEMQPID